jgi:hypothetical protein
MDSGNLQNVLPMLLMKENVDGAQVAGIIKNLVLVNILGKVLPFLGNLIKSRFEAKKKQIEKHFEPLNQLEKERSSGIRMSRRYTTNSPTNDSFDSILWYSCKLPQTKFIKSSPNGHVTITNPEPIEVHDGIFVKQKEIEYSDDGNVTGSGIEIFSNTKDLTELRSFCLRIEKDYQLHNQNKLGDQTFYFDELPVTVPKSIDGGYNYNVAPKNLTFSMTRMCTNKNLHNIFGSAVKKVKERVHFFLKNPTWYADRGIPYTLGIMMYGPPGCGKTSVIKAIAKETKRHVFNVKLSECTTVSQLSQFFYEDRVHVTANGTQQSFAVPMDKRIIVMEDVDCLTDVVLKREPIDTTKPAVRVPSSTPSNPDSIHVVPAQESMSAWEPMPLGGTSFSDYHETPKPPSEPPTQAANGKGPLPTSPEQLTLSHVLNLLDGILETPGRILIMTSNHPEALDPALVRPGRMDVHIKLGHVSRSDIVEMSQGILGKHVEVKNLMNIPENTWTPAETVQAILEQTGQDQVELTRLENKTSK